MSFEKIAKKSLNIHMFAYFFWEYFDGGAFFVEPAGDPDVFSHLGRDGAPQDGGVAFHCDHVGHCHTVVLVNHYATNRNVLGE